MWSNMLHLIKVNLFRVPYRVWKYNSYRENKTLKRFHIFSSLVGQNKNLNGRIWSLARRLHMPGLVGHFGDLQPGLHHYHITNANSLRSIQMLWTFAYILFFYLHSFLELRLSQFSDSINRGAHTQSNQSLKVSFKQSCFCPTGRQRFHLSFQFSW